MNDDGVDRPGASLPVLPPAGWFPASLKFARLCNFYCINCISMQIYLHFINQFGNFHVKKLGKGTAMDFRATIERHEGQLTEADKRLLAELLAHPTEGAFLSAAELATRGNVHAATVVRLARKLGFDGYPSLRAQLQAEVLRKPEPAERISRALARMEGHSLLTTLVENEIASLQGMLDHLSQERVDAAARRIVEARQVYLFAQGQSTALAEMVDRRLRRAGYLSVPIGHHRRDIAERALSMCGEDVVLAFAFRRIPSGLVPLIEHAKALGTTTLLISDLNGPLMRPAPDIVLAAPRGAEGEFHTLTVPMAICNALMLSVSRLDGGRSIEGLRNLESVLKAFEA